MIEISKGYRNQVQLLLQILPIVAEESIFALKGGTAINLFVRDFPRLSVDIDLTYLPIKSRKESLIDIDAALKRIIALCQKRIGGTTYQQKKKNGLMYGAQIIQDNIIVKLEPNTTIRGSVFEPVQLELNPMVQNEFNAYTEMLVLSEADLYGGKLCAAFDRQHPRDLFDVHLLMIETGITEHIKEAFMVYLISHNRPMSELLSPNLSSTLSADYSETFEGMSFVEADLKQLIESWHIALEQLTSRLTDNDREFLLSVKRMEPVWELFPHDHIKDLPAVKWKLLNLSKMSPAKHRNALNKLESVVR